MSVDKTQVGILLAQVALRDRVAFEALYQMTSPRLYTLLQSLVRDDQLAADLLQDGFLKLWYGYHRFPVEYPWAWLCQSMRNLAIDELRKQKRRGDELGREHCISDQVDPEAAPTESSPDNVLGRCLQNLQPEKRNVIALAYQRGLSHQEIVAHVNMPMGTVKSWIRRGLQELKRCLTE